MPRWYRAYQPRFKVDRVLRDLQNLVSVNKLSQYLPVVRVQRNEIYSPWVFLGIEAEQIGEIPVELARILDQVTFLGTPLGDPMELDQIRSMVSAELQLHRYLPLLPVVEIKQAAPIDPGAADDEQRLPSDEAIEETFRHDQLLLILSALSSGSQATLRSIWLELGGNAEHLRPMLRRLRRLGHLETTPDLQRWAIAPTVLVPQVAEDGTTRYLLCGRRDQRLLQLLNGDATAGVKYQPQPYGLGPSAVTVAVDNPVLLQGFLKERGYAVQIAEDVALRLAQLLPADDGWYLPLESLEGIRPHNYRIKRYNGRQFVDQPAFSGESGLYTLQTIDGIRSELTLHYRAGDQRWYRGDWYDLRFAAFAAGGLRFSYAYDADGQQLQIAAAQRWPELYERALILASGLLPELRDGTLIYRGISAELLNTLAPKLRCEPLE